MSLVTHEFDLSIMPGSISPTLRLSQYDDARTFTAHLKDENGDAFALPSGATVTLEGVNCKRVTFQIAASNVSGADVTFTPKEAATDQPGLIAATLHIANGDDNISTLVVVLDVQRAGATKEDVARDPGFTDAIQDAVNAYFDNDPPFFELPSGGQSGQALLSDGADGAYWGETQGGGSGLTDDVKSALMNVASHIGAWTDAQGASYVQALHDALYPPAPVVNLSYITSVFSQGSAVIYNTDSLNKLKQYLTVTAHYENGTSQTVTDYTLSGTLTVGTSTITASYGGKTTTFTVTVTQAVDPEYVIPSEYQEVEWVGKDTEYTGTDNTGPFIRTNITEASKGDLDGYEIDFDASADAGYSANPATFIAWSSKAGCYLGAKNTGVVSFGGTSSENSFSSNIASSTRHTYHMYWTNTSGYAETEGETASRAWTSTGADEQRLVIGNGSVAQAYTKGYKIYGVVVVKKNNVLVGRFVPCYRKSDSVIGFYDTVGEQFYTNSGSSDARVAFVKGADV